MPTTDNSRRYKGSLQQLNVYIRTLCLHFKTIIADRRVGIKQKGKVHKTVVRPAMMYGAEMWAIKKTQEKKLDVAEMRMLRWMCGVTRRDKKLGNWRNLKSQRNFIHN